jgi:mRNA interferase HigB
VNAPTLFPPWEHGILKLACVRIIALKTLRDFWARHPRAEGPLREWYVFVARARWRSTSDIKRDFASASFVGKNRVVFNIGGNNYRLVVVSLLDIGTLYVRFVGTHAKYDKIDVTKV